jgi:hypothetical protein
MYKILLLIISLLILSSCWNLQSTKLTDKYFDKKTIISWDKLNIEPTAWKDKVKFDNFSNFEKSIIKIWIEKWVDVCLNITDLKKQNLCKNVVVQERSKLNNLDCDNLLFYKNKCLDKKNYKNLNCDLIKNSFLKKKCNFEKSYKEAIRNKDKSFCEKLPRIKKKECYKKMWE